MQDGRLFVGGGEPRDDSRHDFEIYTPDCLLRGPRPEFTLSQERVSYGQSLAIRLAGDWRFKHLHEKRIAFIRCCTATHAFNYDQRYVNVQAHKKLRRYASLNGGEYKLQENFYKRIEEVDGEPFEAPDPDDKEFEIVIPDNPNLLPPGYYYLFILSKLGDSSAGAASIAKLICIE